MKLSSIRLPLLVTILGLTSCYSIEAGAIPEHATASIGISSSSGINSARSASQGVALDGAGNQLYSYDLLAEAQGLPGPYSWALKNLASVSSTLTDVMGGGFQVESKASWMDNVTLTGANTETVTLYFSFVVTGFAASGWYDESYPGGGGINHIMGVYVDNAPLQLWDSHYSESGTDSTFAGIGYDSDGSFSGSGSFAMTLSLTSGEAGVASATTGYSVFSNLWANARNGFATGDFSHTTVLTAITLADGSTPESQGYTLSFDSGLLSPNLRPASTVPEPASLPLALVGVTVAVMGYGSGRLRRLNH